MSHHSRRLLVFASLPLLAASAFAAAPAQPGAKEKPDIAADINKPRADARKIAFDTSEGTWMSVDVSPDGKTVVFDLLGDIYSVPVGGGAAKALTRGPAYDTHPRFSPDGRTIAFSSDRGGIENVWLMEADGANPRAVTTEKDAYVRSAAWTPDGNYLVARKEDGKRAGIPPVELWIYHREGGAGIKLTSSDELNNAGGAVASKDGKSIYYAARQRKFNYSPDLKDGLWQIWRYDRDLAQSFPVVRGFGGAVRPALSPDGKLLAYVSRRDDGTVLVGRDLASGSERILARGLTRDEEEGFTQMDLWPNYAFLPDGKSLVFSNRGKLVRLDVASGALADIPFTAPVEQWVAPRVTWQEKVESGPVKARILRWATESADGRWIAFEAFGRVYLQEIAEGKAAGAPRRLTKDDSALPKREYAPAFSPDGKWVAYVSWSDAAGGHVWKAEGAPGSEPVRLTKTAGHYINPAWSPKGDKIAVIRGSGLEFRGHQPEEEEFFEAGVLDAAGGDAAPVFLIKLTDALRFHPQVFWNTDGTRLFYRDPIEPKKPTDDPKNDLVSVRLDGTDRRHLLRFPVVDDIVPSPDGQWVVFTSRDNVYVTALPGVFTKEPPEVNLKEAGIPVFRLSDDAGSTVRWADGGKVITWSLGNTFHRLPLESAVAFAREERRKAEEKKKEEAAKGSPETKKQKDGKEAGKVQEARVPKAQTIEVALAVPRAAPAGSFLLRGARVISMKGDAVLENADVLVSGNRIAGVGAPGTVAAPPSAKVLDAKGATIVPGFIDTHAHLHYSGFELFPETKWEYVANLAYGVTTVYDPSAPSLDVFAQGEAVEAGLMVGPRIYSSGDVLYGGQQTDIFAEVNNLEDARRQVRRMKAYGARMIKVYQQPRRSQRMYFAEACREEHMLLTAEGAGEVQTDMSMVLDGYTAWEHALPVAIHRDIVDFVAKSGTFYTPTLLVAYGGPWGEQYFWQTQNPHDDEKLNRFVPHESIDEKSRRHPWIWPSEYHFPTVSAGTAAVLRAGGNVSLGAHGQLQGLGAHWEIWAMAGEGGSAKGAAMTPMEALRASTILAAEKVGFSPDLGSIETGKLADFIVLDANPLEDIHNTVKIRWVVKNGELWEAGTMKKLWPREEPPPAFFWKK